jgi:hypothetical protein
LELRKEIHAVIEVIWINEIMPEEWHTAIICPIHKKGDKLQCSNYRGRSLLNVCYKILTNILHKRLEPYAQEILGDYQCGFRRERSTTDQLFTLRLVLEKAYEFVIDLHSLFNDFKQAYDTVDRKYIFEVLKEFGIPKKLVNLIKMTLIDSNCRVKIQGQLSTIFKVAVGLRQGDALSAILFNIVLEKAIRNIEINPNGTIFNRTRQYLAYVDDVVILGRSVRATEEMLARLKHTALKAGLVINESETKYSVFQKDVYTRLIFRIIMCILLFWDIPYMRIMRNEM